MKRFECGDVGDKRIACPHRQQEAEPAAAAVVAAVDRGSREEMPGTVPPSSVWGGPPRIGGANGFSQRSRCERYCFF